MESDTSSFKEQHQRVSPSPTLRSLTLVAAVVLIAVVTGAGGYWLEARQAGRSTQDLARRLATTSNWVLYENTAYGFSLAYPPGYDLREETSFDRYGQVRSENMILRAAITTKNPKSGGGHSIPQVNVWVYRRDAPTLDAWVEKHTTSVGGDVAGESGLIDKPIHYWAVQDQRRTVLGGRDAVAFRSGTLGTRPETTLVAKDEYVLAIEIDNDNPSRDPELVKHYPRILASFRLAP